MGDKRFVFCGLAMAQRGHACAIFAAYIVIAAGLSACGGGGSGAGPAPSSDQVIKVTQPPIYRSSLRTPLSFGSGYDTEYQRQIGLTQIGAAAAYDAGYAGFNVKIGIVDTGIDGTHSEIDHIAGGKDFHGNSLGLEDPDGHGTHVASLLVAKRNSLKMHGVAPHASPFSYRIFDGHGTFGSKTGGQIMPSLVSDARHKQIDILNHSWASHYEITDLSKSVISSSLGAELPAWRAAVDDGMALIWAAGNEGDDDVSIRAGLPYHFSDLRKGWLAVVSLDPDGKEPRYTNRCGVAKNWCLAAPGGGDIPFHSGLYGAKSGGGYEKRSGTSMAAPHISGALALVLDAFPQISPQQGISRLLETANYDGLETADGCTLARCGKAAMANVFGRGAVDLAAALQPIGTLSFASEGAPTAVTDTLLDTGLIINEAMLSAATGVHFLAKDSFDDAQFAIPLRSFLTKTDDHFRALQAGQNQPIYHSATTLSGSDPAASWHYITQDSALPISQTGPTYLADISADPLSYWTGHGTQLPQAKTQLHFGYDDDRQALIWQTQSRSDDHPLWVVIGADYTQNRWLDSRGAGGLRWGDGHSQWVSFGQKISKGPSVFTAEYQTGTSQNKGKQGCLICDANARLEAWRLGYELALDEASIAASFGQPLYVKQLDLSLASATKSNVQSKERLVPRSWEFSWQTKPLDQIGRRTYHWRISYQTAHLTSPAKGGYYMSWHVSF